MLTQVSVHAFSVCYQRQVWLAFAGHDGLNSRAKRSRHTPFGIIAPLTIDFLAWIAAAPRDYADVMEAWRTSCPRLTVWEDAIDADLIIRNHAVGQATRIELTAGGKRLLEQHRCEPRTSEAP